MERNNGSTLAVYESTAERYADRNGGPIKEIMATWLTALAQRVPEGGRVFEIAGGHGRDADFMNELGVDVIRTDGAQAMVDIQLANGHDAEVFNVLTDEIPGGQQAILADALLLHFDDDELETALQNVSRALEDGGVFAFTFKVGDRVDWAERDAGEILYRDRSVDYMDEALLRYGLNVEYITQDEPDRHGSGFANVIAVKRSTFS